MTEGGFESIQGINAGRELLLHYTISAVAKCLLCCEIVVLNFPLTGDLYFFEGYRKLIRVAENKYCHSALRARWFTP